MKKLIKITLLALFIGTAGTFLSCSDNDDEPTMTELTLYQKLGGTLKVADPNNPGMMIEKGRLSYRSVVDSTITLIVADIVAGSSGNFGAHFAPLVGEVSGGNTTNVAVLSKNLTDFFSANTGGSATNTYSGASMINAHNPAINSRMGVKATNANFDKFIGYVGAAAGLNGVTDPVVINQVVAVLESLRTQVVQP
ncbi:hypothetical protein [Flavobacterium sp.]|uniref:hypothetical protein n=1 Tax=Flavobacterium sp. TaxID=239 RepID=UPI003D6BAA2A